MCPNYNTITILIWTIYSNKNTLNDINNCLTKQKNISVFEILRETKYFRKKKYLQ